MLTCKSRPTAVIIRVIVRAPPPARTLFVLNPLRIWVQTDGQSAAIMPGLASAADMPLDMRSGVLRAASPIHLRYLQNIGVGASMALSILREDQLWGMIVCHHVTSRYVPHQQRIILESVGHFLTLQIKVREREERSTEMARLYAWTVPALGAIQAGEELFASLKRLRLRLLDFVPATGVSVHIGGKTFSRGKTPSTETVMALAEALAADDGSQIFTSNRLYEHFDDLPNLLECGVCGVMWFRQEITVNVTWAGDRLMP
jgi:chemotaxis family two-component system sensor kinase Cph1